MATVYIEKERCDHVRIANDTGAELAQYEFAVVGPFAAVADEVILEDAVGSYHVEEGIQIQASNLTAAEDTFATIGQKVFFDTATGKFSDTLTVDYYLVGHLLTVKDSDGVILFEKERYAVVVPASLVDIQAEVTAGALNAVHVVDAVIDADASAGIAFDLVADLGMVDGDIITDVMVIATATEASCVLTLSHDGGNAITDGISCVAANAIVRAESLDQAEVPVAAATDLKVTASAGTAANARGIVRISYRRA
jgi:hypothetical protein